MPTAAYLNKQQDLIQKRSNFKTFHIPSTNLNYNIYSNKCTTNKI